MRERSIDNGIFLCFSRVASVLSLLPLQQWYPHSGSPWGISSAPLVCNHVIDVMLVDTANVSLLPGLVKRISKALKDAGGASAEYQLVIIELKGLKNILRQLETLEPTEDNVTHINAIRGMALACQLPLRDFMDKLEEYESTLGPFADRRSLRTMARKSKWATVFADEVERLRAMVAAKNISLNLLLAMNIS